MRRIWRTIGRYGLTRAYAIRVDAVGICTFTALGVASVCSGEVNFYGLTCFIGVGLFFWDLFRVTRP